MSKDYLSFKYPYVLPVASKLRDKRFLASSEHSAELGIEITPQKSVYRKYFWPIFIHLSIFVTYSCGLIVASSLLFGEGASLAILYAPLNEALIYGNVFHDRQPAALNQFRGKPSHQVDKAWYDLLVHTNIKLTKDELRKMNKTTVKLRYDSEFLGQLGVYHHLYCLNYLRQALHSDYYPEMNPEDRGMTVDNCVDELRQALMCHPDTSIVTYDWRPDHLRPWPNLAIDRTCANWERIDAWAGKRSFSIFDQKTPIHPKFGPLFPNRNELIKNILPETEEHRIWPDGNL